MGIDFRLEKTLLHILFGEISVCSSGAVKVQYGPGKGGRRVYFLVFLYGEVFAIVHSVVFDFASRKGGAGKLRNDQLIHLGRGERTHTWHRLWVTGRDTHSSSLFLQSEVCVCALSIVRDS